MAEGGYLFGGTVADFVVVADDAGELTLGAEVPVWFYNARVGGDRYVTGLTDLSGEPITEVISDSTGAIGQLRGPENVPYLWADASGGEGPRRLMVPADLAVKVGGLESRLNDVENIVANLQVLTQSVVLSVVYDEGSATWPPRPALAGSRPVYWHGPDGTPPPAGYMQTNDQFFGWL